MNKNRYPTPDDVLQSIEQHKWDNDAYRLMLSTKLIKHFAIAINKLVEANLSLNIAGNELYIEYNRYYKAWEDATLQASKARALVIEDDYVPETDEVEGVTK